MALMVQPARQDRKVLQAHRAFKDRQARMEQMVWTEPQDRKAQREQQERTARMERMARLVQPVQLEQTV